MRASVFAACLGVLAVAIVAYRPMTARAVLPIVGLYLVFRMWKWYRELVKGADDEQVAS